MNLSVGIVGLPNVGKSTLFNALLKKQAAFVANFPFATIEPNIGVVPVPDDRLALLAKIVRDEDIKILSAEKEKSPSILVSQYPNIPPLIPATVRFVDIAGLVKGAAEGAGLGNKFLSHIREVSIVAHVVRAFKDENVIREGSVDPKSDYETVQTELILADLDSLAKSKTIKKPSILSSIDGKKQEVLNRIDESLNRGTPVRDIGLSEKEKELIKGLFLLSEKPEIVVLNVSEDDYAKERIPEIIKKYSELLYPVIVNEALNQTVQDEVKRSQSSKGIVSSSRSVDMNVASRNDNIIVICAKIESELAELSEIDQKQYLRDLGLDQSGLERLIKKAYETLGLISFLTAGEKEVRAWTIKKGTNAVEAAGEIHTDFMKKFIKAEVVSFEDFVKYGGWKKAREHGKTRFEGKDYVMQDGDVVEFKIGA